MRRTPGQAKAAFRAAFDRIAQLDAALSDYQPDSEVNRLCRVCRGQAREGERRSLPRAGRLHQVAEETGGAFDVTLGPVTLLWRQARQRASASRAGALREALQRSGYRKLHLDAAARTVTLDQAGMRLDLGGIAKGYAADAGARRPGGTRHPPRPGGGQRRSRHRRSAARTARLDASASIRPRAAGFSRVLDLCNAAVSTSGDAYQNLETGGVKYSHIIDPSTGMGLTRPIAVTVVARHGIDADSWSTALSVLGPERGIALIEKHPGLAARFTLGREPPFRIAGVAWLAGTNVPDRTSPVRSVGIPPPKPTTALQHPYIVRSKSYVRQSGRTHPA